MRITIAFFLVVISGSTFAMDPDQAFDSLIDAMYQKDAEVLMSYLSTESLGLIDMVLEALKIESAEILAEISEEIDIDITVKEVDGWASVDLIEALITSPEFIAELPPRENLLSSGFEIQGDSSLVLVDHDTFAPRRMLMVKEGDNWKLDQSVIGSYLM